MKNKIPLIARILLGLLFTMAGISGLIMGMQVPPDAPESMKLFVSGMSASIYFFPLLKLTETLCGLALLSGFFVPLALVVLAPIVLNIFLVNAFLMPSTLPLGAVIGLVLVYLSFFARPYADTVRSLFRLR